MQGIQVFVKAVDFAAKKHTFQRRKNADVPYINHPLEVAQIISSSNVNQVNVLAAAVLHDVIQDTETTPQQLIKEFGQEIADIVFECSDDKSLPKVQRKKKQIQKSGKVSKSARIVKLGDKISNNRQLMNNPPKDWQQQRIMGYSIWSNQVLKQLKDTNIILQQNLHNILSKSNIFKLSQQQYNTKLANYYKLLKQKKD